MRSITLAQAALFAAMAMSLLAVFFLVDNPALLREAPVLLLLGSVVPSVIWAGFFLAVWRRSSFVKMAAWIALVFAVLLEALVVYIRFQQQVSYWTPFGNALSLSGWLLRLGWAAFLISFALAPDRQRTRRIALVLAIISTPIAFNEAYVTFNNWIGVLFDEIPRQAFWRVLITPVIRTVYWLSQIIFLWTAWANPVTRDPIETLSAHLGP